MILRAIENQEKFMYQISVKWYKHFIFKRLDNSFLLKIKNIKKETEYNLINEDISLNERI